MKQFKYQLPTEILFGSGTIEKVGEVVAKYGKRCLIVTSPGSHIDSLMHRVRKILTNSGVEVIHYNRVIPNPTTETISEGAQMALEFDTDVILGLGGGSSMDAAKAIAVEATHEGSAWDYLFYKEPGPDPGKVLPVIAVSTTSGTGSQVTQVSVVTNTQQRDKSALYHPALFPRVAIIDPDLMATLPERMTAYTGFDVFCHAFESLLHPESGAFTYLMAREAVRLVFQNLPKVLANGSDREAREQMAWADTLAGNCIANAGVTLPHGMGMAVSGLYPHVAHGEALAILYPACTRYTSAEVPEIYAFLARELDPGLRFENEAIAAGEAYPRLVEFLKSIGLYKGLKDVGMPEEEISLLAERSMVLPDFRNHPKVPSYDEMTELVIEAYAQ